MNVLFVHPNFPGQFRSIAPALAAAGCRVAAVGQAVPSVHAVPGVSLHCYKQSPFRLDPRYPPLEAFAHQLRQGKAAVTAFAEVRASGFVPDIVVGHPGWGDMIFLDQVFPGVPVIAYLEFFYRGDGIDVGFDREFPHSVDREAQSLRNLVQLLAHQAAARCVAPTRWQRDLFPQALRRSITVQHEGVDTSRVAPDAAAALALPDGRVLSRATPVLTYCARNLEPYRGFHVFMRNLGAIQRDQPGLFTIIVGGDEVSYGRPPPDGGQWRTAMLDEVGGDLDLDRIWFAGRLSYEAYLSVLQVSAVHVYLTYPFVLSWSAIEAMAAGCAIVASDTPPVAEVLADGRNARLVPFFDGGALVSAIGRLLSDAGERARLAAAARADAVARFDFDAVALPAWRALLKEAAGRSNPFGTVDGRPSRGVAAFAGEADEGVELEADLTSDLAFLRAEG